MGIIWSALPTIRLALTKLARAAGLRLGSLPAPADGRHDEVVQSGAPTVRRSAALAFKSGYDLPQLRVALNAAGDLEWVERESAWFGDYLSTRIAPHYAFFKIYDDEPNAQYVLQVNVSAEPDAGIALLAELVALARDRVLPAIGARDIAPTETYD